MVLPTLLFGAAVAGYFLIGVGVIGGLARLILAQNTGEEPPTIQPLDWLVLAFLAAIWPIVLALLAILSLAAVILSRLCRN
jgi:hypothetical protein